MPRIEALVTAADGGLVREVLGEDFVQRKRTMVRNPRRDPALVGQQLARGPFESGPPDLVDIILAHRVPEVPAGVLQEVACLDCPGPSRWRAGGAKALKEVRKCIDQLALDALPLAAAQALDLLDHVLPVDRVG